MGRKTLFLSLLFVVSWSAPGNGCSGRNVLTDDSGIIVSGESKERYPNYARCEWLIDAGDPQKSILLEFEHLATECSYDFLFVFDGPSYNSPMMASLSGENLQDPIVASSGQMLIYLFSDRNYQLSGFSARYVIQDCPWNCSGRGACIDHTCVCDTQYSGHACDTEVCPNDCGEHGHCNTTDDDVIRCHCDNGYSGHMCNISLNDSLGSEYWYELALAGSGFESRTAHAGAYLPQSNCLYTFGGYTLNNILSDLKVFCTERNEWEDKAHREPWPDGRHEHAIAQYGYGFYMFGGIRTNGSFSNELWYYNASKESWSLCADNSTIEPLKVSGHTLTVVDDELYLFGGKTEDGLFWSNMYKISAIDPKQWIRITPNGGKSSERRLVGHSSVYHKESKSLLIYGGYSYSPDQPRYGTHTNNLHAFHIEHRIWSQINAEDSMSDEVPKQRSFHTAQIVGNYMVVFGGNTHIHNKLELCYDYRFYLYHLECHTWVRIDLLMGKYSEELESLFHKGRVGHVSALAYGNILLVSGGYSGRVLGDLIAFKFPSFVVPPQSEADLNLDYCSNYTRVDKCGYNPDCLYCDNVTTTGARGCIHRSLSQLCQKTEPYYPKARCPGICSTLHTCMECLSQGQGASLSQGSRPMQTYIQPCNWCVKEARCQDQTRPSGTCLSPTATVTGNRGWWGGLSASLSTVAECRDGDYPAGLQAVKYRHIENSSQPDEVKIIRQTTEMEEFRRIYNTNVFMDHVRWMGYIHPNNATIKSGSNLYIDRLMWQSARAAGNTTTETEPDLDTSMFYTLKSTVANISVNVYISRDETIGHAEKVAAIPMDRKLAASRKHKSLEFDSYQDGTPLFSNRSRGQRYFIDVKAEHVYPKYSVGMKLGLSMYSLTLKWNGIDQSGTPKDLKVFHPFSYEYLEPYSTGACHRHTNCLACMTDTLCGWCGSDDTCILRNTTTVESECNAADKEQLLITDASMCPVCPDHMDCPSCAADALCEWMTDHVCCVRLGRNTVGNKTITTADKCYASCHRRNSCNLCMMRRECAWCENLQTCLPFSDYVSRHRHGQCTEWIDSEETSENPYTCKDCAAKGRCGDCLATFSCGWCGNTVDPRYGVCVEGDFSGPYSSSTCSVMVHSVHPNMSTSDPAAWSYGTCPDVEECLLGLAQCHLNATCINTPTTYNCTCNRGYTGDGKDICEKTCYHKCVNGMCMEEYNGDFTCDCDLGWTGVDCAEDCLCNKHSMCYTGTGKCDHCLNGTTGPFCNSCLDGHFGDPTKPDGCFPCQCNEHGDENQGLCHNETGECFCVDNTMGFDCEQCQDGYYGDPREGGRCYLHCDHGLVLENVTSGSLGSHQGPGVTTWRAYCLWILTVYPRLDKFWRPQRDPPFISLTMEDLHVECERDHVYVYDGIPTFVDSAGSGELLGAFCGFHHGELQSVMATSGIITVYFDADISGNFSRTREFNASYTVNACRGGCTGNQRCVGAVCVCKSGFLPPDCSKKICPRRCQYIETSNSCLCEADFGGSPYHLATYPWDVNSTVFTSHATNGPISRYGHVWINCDDEIGFLFGGRSLERGLLNDIWQYNFSTHTWLGIVPITDDRPSGRYFHAGSCVPVLKHLYIFGGLVMATDQRLSYVASKQMWKFAIDNKKWTGPIEPAWVNGVAGHTMTLVQETILVIIGGFSTTKYFSDTVYKYDANSYLSAWSTFKLNNATGAKPTGIYGHSAVYNRPSNTIYIYGGHIYKDERLLVSAHLFTYTVDDDSWNILQPERKSNLETRYFHATVGFADYMLVIGGFTHHRNTSGNILVYRYDCNFWYKLDLTGTAAGKVLTSLIGAQVLKYNNSVYITGGFNNLAHSEVYQLSLPADICSLNGDATSCVNYPGCSALIVQNGISGNVTLCYDSKGKAPARQSGASVAELPGEQCNLQWHAARDCMRIVNCSECVAVYPQFKHAEPSCVWCSSCMLGQCIPRGYVCKAAAGLGCDVGKSNVSDTKAVLHSKATCAVSTCAAATCGRCKELRCMWTRHFQRILHRAGEISRSQSYRPMYDWTCVMASLANSLDIYKLAASTSKCPAPCYIHEACDVCLQLVGGEAGSKECYWSDTLQECMPPAYLSLHCAGGECGTILQGGPDKCPQPCDVHKKCADCRKAPGCGWCAFGGLNGLGVCMAGKRNGPSDGQCDLDNVQPLKNGDLLNFQESKTLPDWTYATCPPEDECSNGHHSCDPETQNCKDKLTGFSCECKPGYVWKDEQQKCKPVCHEGCIHGVCTQPDRCQCHFGYVGRNCSAQCECNRHSNCESVAKKDVCLECMNNTQGSHCEVCKPLFVGNPLGGGRCVSCTEFCNYHTDICLYWTDYNNTLSHIRKKLRNSPDNITQDLMSMVAQILTKGPENAEKTHCVDCRHHTHRIHCDECEPGYFRLNPVNKSEPCSKCMCNGHSDTCDRDGGQNCHCQNNTETRCNSEGNDQRISCHEVQCAVCKEYFLGTPTNGHQCFRQMHVNREYCFDPNTQSECLRNPTPLVLGHTVFFVVQPKYLNVDIRVTIDISQGGVDVYFSPNENTFAVDVNKVRGIHTVRLDNSERVVSVEEFKQGSRVTRSTNRIFDKYQNNRKTPHQILNVSTGTPYYISEINAKDINTFITVDKPNTVLVIRNVKYRLVITLPNDPLDLQTSKFYITFASIGDRHANETVGSLYFRQDQPHIDLFVFFSVFFSCFFLFLAMCVLLWKTKQAFDSRRTRQQRAREMQHMASRPFAKVLVLIEHSPVPYNISPRLHLPSRVGKATVRTPLLPSEINTPLLPTVARDSLAVIPIAVEPADDGMAAVRTVVFQLPGGTTVPLQLCLGCTLTKGCAPTSATGKLRRPPASSQC